MHGSEISQWSRAETVLLLRRFESCHLPRSCSGLRIAECQSLYKHPGNNNKRQIHLKSPDLLQTCLSRIFLKNRDIYKGWLSVWHKQALSQVENSPGGNEGAPSLHCQICTPVHVSSRDLPVNCCSGSCLPVLH